MNNMVETAQQYIARLKLNPESISHNSKGITTQQITLVQQTGMDDKLLYVERVRIAGHNEEEYVFGYVNLRDGKWHRAPTHMFAPLSDFWRLLDKAMTKEEGTIIPRSN